MCDIVFIGVSNYKGLLNAGNVINGMPPSINPNGLLPSNAQPHRTLPSMVPFGRSNSLGRSLPPIPCGNVGGINNPNTIKPQGPTLVRRRTFEDDNDQRTDWI